MRRVITAAECADICVKAIAGLNYPIEISVYGQGRSDLHRIDLAVSQQSGTRSRRMNDDPLRSPIARCGSSPPERPVCRRRPRSVIAGSSSGATGSPASPALTATDRLYNCLPMHHSVGGVVAIGAPLVFGGSVAIAERFSARSFWGDVARWECTAFQYIGELCRYLVAAPSRPRRKPHRLRLAIGNGLSEEVWRSVLDRFGPLRILEFYASTEGNVWLYNVEGKIGSIGRVPPYLALRDPIALARFDHNSQMPVRGADGFCARCADGEIGEALGRIGEDPGRALRGLQRSCRNRKENPARRLQGG